MILDDICRRLDAQFRVNEYRETWPQFALAGVNLRPFASAQFLATGNGLLVRGAVDVPEAYTAVFPSPAVIDHVIARAMAGTLLICHYPLHFDGRRGFLAPTEALLAQAQARGISLYALHAPLAAADTLSTWQALARTLGLAVEGTFQAATGQRGCYGPVQIQPNLRDVFDFDTMVMRVEEALGIRNSQVVENLENVLGRVALVPGDGADPELLTLAANANCHTYVTGILDNPVDDPVVRQRSQAFLSLAQTMGLNLIGASQYTTEAPGLRLLATWLQALGLTANFVPDQPELPEFLIG